MAVSEDVAKGLGDRIEEFKSALGYRTLEEMATELRRLTGTRTKGTRLSEWKKAPPGADMLAAFSLLHPTNPRGCLKWLRDGGEMPPIAASEVVREDQATDGMPPGSPGLLAVLKSLAWDVGQLRVDLKNLKPGDDHEEDKNQGRANHGSL